VVPDPGRAVAALAEEPPISKGFEYFYNLQYDDSIAEFTRQVAEQPYQPAGYNHLAQAILYRDMFRAGALESELVSGSNPFLRRSKVDASPEDQRKFDQAIGRAMELAQATLKRNPNDTQRYTPLGFPTGCGPTTTSWSARPGGTPCATPPRRAGAIAA